MESLAAHGLIPAQTENWQSFLASSEPFAIATAPIDRGLYLGHDQPALVCEAQLYGNRVAQRRRRRVEKESDSVNIYRDLTELREGVPVVHLEHGVGRYVGLQTLTINEQETEFLTLSYAEGERCMCPSPPCI